MIAQERFVGNSADIRTILNFEISPVAIEEILPPNWIQNPETSGPAAGANLRVTFVIPLSGADAVGRPAPNIRYVIFSVPVKSAWSIDANQLMLITGLTNGGAGPYDTNVNAKDTITHKTYYAGATMLVDESWNFIGDDGSAVSMELQYTRGLVVPHTAESRVFSRANPSFSRMYKYQEGADVVQLGATQQERLRKFTFRAQGGKLSRLFDGAEKLISVIALPWYNREIYLLAD